MLDGAWPSVRVSTVYSSPVALKVGFWVPAQGVLTVISPLLEHLKLQSATGRDLLVLQKTLFRKGFQFRKESGFQGQSDLESDIMPPYTSCVTSGQSLTFSMLQCLHL